MEVEIHESGLGITPQTGGEIHDTLLLPQRRDPGEGTADVRLVVRRVGRDPLGVLLEQTRATVRGELAEEVENRFLAMTGLFVLRFLGRPLGIEFGRRRRQNHTGQKLHRVSILVEYHELHFLFSTVGRVKLAEITEKRTLIYEGRGRRFRLLHGFRVNDLRTGLVHVVYDIADVRKSDAGCEFHMLLGYNGPPRTAHHGDRQQADKTD